MLQISTTEQSSSETKPTYQEEVDGVLNILKRLDDGFGSTAAVLVGSRRVFKQQCDIDEYAKLIDESTDWDFMMVDSEASRAMLKTLGFIPKYNGQLDATGYGSIASTEVFVRYSSDGLLLPIQVVTKQPEYWYALCYFWRLMSSNREVFKTIFWKRNTVLNTTTNVLEYPNTHDLIRERIEHWLLYVIPCIMEK